TNPFDTFLSPTNQWTKQAHSSGFKAFRIQTNLGRSHDECLEMWEERGYEELELFRQSKGY
ncbi:hypothetical protein P7K49_031950, partial [Saguinus oedipus]